VGRGTHKGGAQKDAAAAQVPRGHLEPITTPGNCVDDLKSGCVKARALVAKTYRSPVAVHEYLMLVPEHAPVRIAEAVKQVSQAMRAP